MEVYVGGFFCGDFCDMLECVDFWGINGERILLWYFLNFKSWLVFGFISNGIWVGIVLF